MPKLQQRFHRNLWWAERKSRALWIQHPGRNCQSAAVDKLTHDAFTGALLPALVNAQRLTEAGMPTVVDGDSLKEMGIM
jgi:hypothetical protein